MNQKLYLLGLLLIFSAVIYGQNVGIGTTNPDPSALLHLQANNKGLLIPNVTAAERLLVASPANGLIVYQRDEVSGIYVNKSLNPTVPNWVHLTEGINLWTQHPGNTDQFYSLSNANIGINNTQPQQKLSVGGGITVDANGQNNGGFDNSLKFGGDSGSSLIQSNKLGTINPNGLDFYTNSSRRLSILNNGNVGIGLTNPLSKLSLNGNLSIGSTYAGTNAAPANGLLVQGNTSLGTSVSLNRLDINGGTALGLNYAGIKSAPANGLIVEGNVGIGTDEPISKLTTVTPFAQYGYLHSDPTGTVQVGSYISSNAGWLGTKTNHSLQFFTNNSLAQMTLGTTGNLGIGTSSPNTNALLDLTSTSKGLLLPRLNNTQMGGLASVAPDGMLIYNTDQTGLFIKRSGSFVKLIDVAATMTLPYSSMVSDSGPLFTVQNSGTGGALWATTNSNTSPAVHAESNGTGRAFEAISTTGDAGYFSTTNNNATAIEVGLGRVGIGTATPKNRLDVEGAVVIGSIYSGTNTASPEGLLVEGRVGLGTLNPQNKLDVEGGVVIGPNFSGSVTAPSDGLLVEGRSGFGTTTPQNKVDVEGGAVIGTGYSGTNIAPSNGLLVEGRVGIGTNNPDAAYALDINGRMRLRHGPYTSGMWFNKSDNTEASFLGMINDTTFGIWGNTGVGNFKNAFNQRNGNFGINVTNPLKPLTFDNNLGNKISLWGAYDSDHYGLGIAGNTFRMYVPNTTERFEFGHGDAISFSEVARLTADGKFYLGTQTSEFNSHLEAYNANALLIVNKYPHTTNTQNIFGFRTEGRFDASIRTIATSSIASRLGFFTLSSLVHNNQIERMSITNSGDVLIGTQDETNGVGYRLRVNGKIITDEVRVQAVANWPDYVFKQDYKLSSLSEVAAFIDKNSHLPGIPSADEVEKDGFEVADMQKKMLQKIEELTLYIIDLNKKIEEQQKVIETIKMK